MPLPDFTKVVRKELPSKVVTITHDSFGEYSFSVSKLTIPQLERAKEKAIELARKYVVGGWRGEDGAWRDDPADFLGTSGPVDLSYKILEEACIIERMQGVSSDRMSWEQVVKFADSCNPEEGDTIYLQLLEQCLGNVAEKKVSDSDSDELGKDSAEQ